MNAVKLSVVPYETKTKTVFSPPITNGNIIMANNPPNANNLNNVNKMNFTAKTPLLLTATANSALKKGGKVSKNPFDEPQNLHAHYHDYSSHENASNYSQTYSVRSKSSQSRIGAELRNQIRLFVNLAVPMMLVNLGTQAVWVLSSSFAGRKLGPRALGGFALATLAGNIIGKSFVVGILSGFDTLAGAAFGAQNYEEIGLLVQRSMVINSILIGFIVVLWLNIEPILMLLQQPAEVIVYASSFLKMYSLIFPAEMAVELMKSFYRCQNISIPFVYITFITCVAHYFALEYFVDRYNYDGIAYSHMASTYLFFSLSMFYFAWFKHHHPDSWRGINLRKTMHAPSVYEYLTLGIPGILANSEWWFWELQTVFVGSLGAAQLAAHSMAYNVLPMAYLIPFGVGLAVQTRVATLLAKGDYQLAMKVSFTAIFMNFCLGICTFSFIYLCKDAIFAFFLSDTGPGSAEDDVIYEANRIWLVVAIFTNLDAQLALCDGVFRGASLHARLSVIMVIMLFVVGVPIELITGFGTNMGLLGFWVGMVIIYIMLDSIMLGVIFFMDWESKVPDMMLQERLLKKKKRRKGYVKIGAYE